MDPTSETLPPGSTEAPHVPRGPELLAKYMADHGLSQLALAAQLGINQSTLSRWLSGELRPGISWAFKMQRELGIPADSWLDAVAA